MKKAAENAAQELADELSQQRAQSAEAFVAKVEEELASFLDKDNNPQN